MQISSRFTVALHIFTCVDVFKDQYKVTSDFLAGSINTNPVIIRKILSQLSKADLITVARGTGGITINRPVPLNISSFRFILLFGIVFGIYILISSSALNRPIDQKSKLYAYISVGVTTVFLLFALLITVLYNYNGNGFFTDKYNVPEEELICWSETSLRSPLNEAGFNRYMEVCRLVYPDAFADIVGLKGA